MRLSWLILIGLMGITPARAGDIPVPTGGGYAMPIFGERQNIFSVYQAPDGHLVFEFFFRDHGIGKSDFYDTQTGKRLFPAQEVAMAYSRGGALGRELRPSNLTEISVSLVKLTGPHPEDFAERVNNSGSECGKPYSSFTTFSDPLITVDVAFFVKRQAPETWRGPCHYRHATLHYNDAPMEMMAPDEKGFFGLFRYQSLLVRFAWNGHSSFFDGQDRIVAVRYDDILAVEHKTDDEDARRFDKVDALIARQVGRQLKAKKHV